MRLAERDQCALLSMPSLARHRGVAAPQPRRSRNWVAGQSLRYACAMALVGPPPMLDSNPFSVMLEDLRSERSGVPYPPGETRFSIARTRRFANEPLEMLLEAYARYGPVFTLRVFHSNVVFMLGPEANHYLLVSHASNFTWRDGHF